MGTLFKRNDPLFPSETLLPSDELYPSDGNIKGVNKGMITFTDKRLYAKGTCMVNLHDPCTMGVLYSSDKFQTGNITSSVTMGEIRAGMGNSVATMIPSDASLNVEFNAADFSLYVKAAQLGAAMTYSAPTPVCEVITMPGFGSIPLPANKVAVAPLGYDEPVAWVQEVGESGTVAGTGTPYKVFTDTNKVNKAGESGKSYRVTWFVNDATAELVTIGGNIDPKVVYFTAQIPVFSNEGCASTNEGNRVGWIYVVIPRLKLSGNGGIVGDQSNADTTTISGQALSYQSDIITADCQGCSGGGVLGYYVYAADNGADNISGLAVVGGVVSVPTGEQAQIPVRFVMGNGELVTPSDYSTGFLYQAVNPPAGTNVGTNTGLITAGGVPGDFDVIVSYGTSGTPVTTYVEVSVISA